MNESKTPGQNTKAEFSGNSIMVRPDGPLVCKGDEDIILLDSDGELILKGREFALCRCGLSKNKPFCDGSHKTNGFQAEQEFTDPRAEDISEMQGTLTITVKNNAMYSLKGPVTIFSRSGVSITTRLKGALCRCGHSENKPFCDTKHKQCGFKG